MRTLRFIDITPQYGKGDRYNVDLLRLSGGHTFPHIQDVDFDFIDRKLGEVGWFLLQQQFKSTRSLRTAEIEATPEQLGAFGFKLEDLMSAGWA
jgi:hypothetical protein